MINTFEFEAGFEKTKMSWGSATTCVVGFRPVELNVPWLQGNVSFIFDVLEVVIFDVHVELYTGIFDGHLPVGCNGR